MQSRAYVARVSGAGGARCAPLSAPVGVLVEINLHVQRNRCALSYNSERATRAPAFGFHCSCAQLSLSLSASLFLCRLSASLSASLSPWTSLSASLSLDLSLSLRLSLPPRLSLFASVPRSASRLNLRVCDNPSLRFSFSSFQPRLHLELRKAILRNVLEN